MVENKVQLSHLTEEYKLYLRWVGVHYLVLGSILILIGFFKE